MSDDNALLKMVRHTKAKHTILETYLAAWFPILNTQSGNLLFIDGFAGPGRYKNGDIGSPLIALEVAKKHATKLQGDVRFVFIEEDERSFQHLQDELLQVEVPSNFCVSSLNGDFYKETTRILDELEVQAEELPIFANIDPFGFKGVPFHLIRRILECQSCEVLITFMVDSINRWVKEPERIVAQHERKVLQNIVDLFGTEDALSTAESSSDRIHDLLSLYMEQLSEKADYVRPFQMLNDQDRTIYYLIHCSNHRKGHVKMKEAMWKVAEGGELKVSDATNPDQLLLFGDNPTEAAWQTLKKEYDGKEVTTDDILRFGETETQYLWKHVREALETAENDGLVTVSARKSGGDKRRRGTFPRGVRVSFVEDRGLFS